MQNFLGQRPGGRGKDLRSDTAGPREAATPRVWNRTVCGGEDPDSRGSGETQEKTGRLHTHIDSSEGVGRGMSRTWQGRGSRLFKSSVGLVVCWDTWRG